MFKIFVAVILLTLSNHFHPMTVFADTATEITKDDSKVSLPKERAELLILHATERNDTDKNNLRLLVDMFSSLNKSVEYGTWSDYESLIHQYTYILCFGLTELPDDVINRLDQTKAKLMIIGYDFMKQYLTCIKRFQWQAKEQSEVKSVLTYEFSPYNEFQTMLQIDGMIEISHSTYRSGIIQIKESTYPFCCGIKRVRYLPMFDYDNEVSYLAVLRELAIWMWEYQDSVPEYYEYVVLDMVQPYIPTQLLKEKIELLIESNLPFVISVMPAWLNTDYPAMQQFCEVLKYAQDNRGAIILHAPYNCESIHDYEEFSKRITKATKAYNEYGVYPLGIEVPRSMLYDEEALAWLRLYKTVFVYENQETYDFDMSVHRNLIYYNYHTLIQPVVPLDDSGVNYSRNFASAYYIDCSIRDNSELIRRIELLKESYIHTKSLWNMTHSVWGNDYHLSYEAGTLSLNDEVVSTEYIPTEYEKEHNYNRNTVRRVTVSIKDQSNELMIGVLVITITFILMIIYARVCNRNMLLGKRIKKKGGRT